MTKFNHIYPGSIIVADGGFTCIDPGAYLEVKADKKGRMYVECKFSFHYLDGQLDGDELVGFHLVMPDRMPNMMQDLVDFSEHFGLTYDGPPSHLVPYSLEEFRSNCLFEEILEYETAKSIEGKLDALIDLIYFALGTAYLHGFAPIFYEAWQRVHAANMSKVRSPASEESAARGCAFDVVKPPGFTPPDLSDLVQR